MLGVIYKLYHLVVCPAESTPTPLFTALSISTVSSTCSVITAEQTVVRMESIGVVTVSC